MEAADIDLESTPQSPGLQGISRRPVRTPISITRHGASVICPKAACGSRVQGNDARVLRPSNSQTLNERIPMLPRERRTYFRAAIDVVLAGGTFFLERLSQILADERCEGSGFRRTILGALALRMMTGTPAHTIHECRVVDGLSVGALARLFAVGRHAKF
jgi:hypothetical protein